MCIPPITAVRQEQNSRFKQSNGRGEVKVLYNNLLTNTSQTIKDEFVNEPKRFTVVQKDSMETNIQQSIVIDIKGKLTSPKDTQRFDVELRMCEGHWV